MFRLSVPESRGRESFIPKEAYLSWALGEGAFTIIVSARRSARLYARACNSWSPTHEQVRPRCHAARCPCHQRSQARWFGDYAGIGGSRLRRRRAFQELTIGGR